MAKFLTNEKENPVFWSQIPLSWSLQIYQHPTLDQAPRVSRSEGWGIGLECGQLPIWILENKGSFVFCSISPLFRDIEDSSTTLLCNPH